jgi:hypothetical protein
MIKDFFLLILLFRYNKRKGVADFNQKFVRLIDIIQSRFELLNGYLPTHMTINLTPWRTETIFPILGIHQISVFTKRSVPWKFKNRRFSAHYQVTGNHVREINLKKIWKKKNVKKISKNNRRRNWTVKSCFTTCSGFQVQWFVNVFNNPLAMRMYWIN